MRSIDDVIDRWQQWDGAFHTRPRLLSELAGGLTNRSYLVACGSDRSVVRLNSTKDHIYGIDRRREQRILADATAAGLAPPVRHCDVEYGILISAYIDGQAAQPPASARARDELIALTQRIHNLATDIDIEDYYAHAARYREQLQRRNIEVPAALLALGEVVAQEHASGAHMPDASSLCHRDLNPTNVIDYDGRLYVLDWEYATRGNAAFDYAALATEWDLDSAAICRATGTERHVLEHAIRLYRYTCELWRLQRG